MNPVPIDHLMMGGGIVLIVGVALLFLGDLLPGGWGEVARGRDRTGPRFPVRRAKGPLCQTRFSR